MKIKYKLLLAIGLVIVGTSALFSTILYHTQKEALLGGIDAQLLTAARFTEGTLPVGYHDAIVDENSVAAEDYRAIVDRYNGLCKSLGLQYVWSVLVLGKDHIVFTSGTSTSKTLDRDNQDWASFYARHENPEAFAEALAQDGPTYSSFENEWGRGRMVLVPGKDARGRTYIFGASMSVEDVDRLLARTLRRSFLIGAVVFLLGVPITFVIANSISRPIVEMTRVAKSIAKGELDQRVRATGSAELESLSASINAMSRSIREQITELEKKNAELERFTYTASHDLKSPLTTIKGFLGILRRDIAANNAERVEHDLDRIATAADRMLLFLNDLLELSRIGRLMNPPEDVPLTLLAQQAVEMTDGAIAARHVRVDISDTLPVVRGDKLRLLQVIQNLIDNAAKYGGDRPGARIEVGCRQEDGRTVCFVRDDGLGIDPRYHKRVFSLFEKLDPKTEGTGIGLALCKRIVETHCGTMWIESQGSGSGTTVCFTLPPASAAP